MEAVRMKLTRMKQGRHADLCVMPSQSLDSSHQSDETNWKIKIVKYKAELLKIVLLIHRNQCSDENKKCW